MSQDSNMQTELKRNNSVKIHLQILCCYKRLKFILFYLIDFRIKSWSLKECAQFIIFKFVLSGKV